jgi:hypothetical protein
MFTRAYLAGLTLTTFLLAMVMPLALPAADLSLAPYQYLSLDVPNALGAFGMTTLTDINDHGIIIGSLVDSSAPGFVLGPLFTRTPLSCAADGMVGGFVQPTAINSRGDIVGLCQVDEMERGFLRRIRRTRPPLLSFINFPGARQTEVLGINDQGALVGTYADTDMVFHGFLLADGVFLPIDAPFPGTMSTILLGINRQGEMVGFFQDSAGKEHGLRVSLGQFTAVDVPDARFTQLFDINAEGQVIGLYALADGGLHSFLFDHGTFLEVAVPFPGAVFTEVSGLNNHGVVVGRWVESRTEGDVTTFLSHGFLATPAGLQAPTGVAVSEEPQP